MKKEIVSTCYSDQYVNVFLTFLKTAKPHCILKTLVLHVDFGGSPSPGYPKSHGGSPGLGERLAWWELRRELWDSMDREWVYQRLVLSKSQCSQFIFPYFVPFISSTTNSQEELFTFSKLWHKTSRKKITVGLKEVMAEGPSSLSLSWEGPQGEGHLIL